MGFLDFWQAERTAAVSLESAFSYTVPVWSAWEMFKYTKKQYIQDGNIWNLSLDYFCVLCCLSTVWSSWLWPICDQINTVWCQYYIDLNLRQSKVNSSFPTIGINWINIKKQKKKFLVVIHTLPPQVPITCRGFQHGPSFVLCGAVLSAGESGASGAQELDSGIWTCCFSWELKTQNELAGMAVCSTLRNSGVCQGPVRRRRFWNVSLMRKAGAVQPGAEKARGDLSTVYKYLEGGCKEARARLSSVLPSERHRGSGHTGGPIRTFRETASLWGWAGQAA